MESLSKTMDQLQGAKELAQVEHDKAITWVKCHSDVNKEFRVDSHQTNATNVQG